MADVNREFERQVDREAEEAWAETHWPDRWADDNDPFEEEER